MTIMYSPKERIYNTPEQSGPTGKAVLQQLRLEAILRKYCRLECCEPCVYSSKQAPSRLPEIKKPFKNFRSVDDVQTFEKIWHNLDIPRKTPREHSKNVCSFQENLEADCDRNKRSVIPGAPPDDPYLQRHRDTVGGCKYGGVNLSENAENRRPNAVIFRPFYPQKSPLRLPCIQREKTVLNKKQSAPKPTMTSRDVTKHINILQKKQTHLPADMKRREAKQRRKRVLEHEFHEWEQSQDFYLQKAHEIDADNLLLANFERFHETERGPPFRNAEQVQRTRISEGIKEGVQRKMDMFREVEEKVKLDIPVYDLTFVKDNDTFEQHKTTVKPETEKKNRKTKHTHT